MIRYFPRPMSKDLDEINEGRQRALRQYQDAKTDGERIRAMIWVNHWRLQKAWFEGRQAIGGYSA